MNNERTVVNGRIGLLFSLEGQVLPICYSFKGHGAIAFGLTPKYIPSKIPGEAPFHLWVSVLICKRKCWATLSMGPLT